MDCFFPKAEYFITAHGFAWAGGMKVKRSGGRRDGFPHSVRQQQDTVLRCRAPTIILQILGCHQPLRRTLATTAKRLTAAEARVSRTDEGQRNPERKEDKIPKRKLVMMMFLSPEGCDFVIRAGQQSTVHCTVLCRLQVATCRLRAYPAVNC